MMCHSPIANAIPRDAVSRAVKTRSVLIARLTNPMQLDLWIKRELDQLSGIAKL
jgi:hypothetical protein